MKLKMKQLIRTRRELEILEEFEVTPPGDLMVPLIRNLRHINAALDDYDEAMRRVIREVGEPHQGGWRIPPDDTEGSMAYDKARREAADAEVDIDVHPLALSRFLKAKKDKPKYDIPLSVLRRLDYLIVIDDDATGMLEEDKPDGE